ncbi:leucine-rich repeat protein [Ruminococcus sp.]|uniref:leucine-rich repeat protein n=1 Tax=Ruminococcus sp. TaxID=41978 RepID=UPI0025E5BCD2|nr:leucine-rich repeat protein [Ruminococcus sp.]MCR4639204.1 leucine-rich repeat protein [Ruminococcus sp.]
MKKFIAAALSAAICIGAVSAANICAATPDISGISAENIRVAESGKCGNDAYWSYENGKLTITGSGEMGDWDGGGYTPWAKLRKQLTSVEIGEGITTVGTFAFSNCTMITSLKLPSTLKELEMCCFQDCDSLESADLPSGLTTIGSYSFKNCNNLKRVVVRSTNCQFIGGMDTISNDTANRNNKYTGVIAGYPGSTAETYASKSGYSFEELKGAPPETTVSSITTAAATTTTTTATTTTSAKKTTTTAKTTTTTTAKTVTSTTTAKTTTSNENGNTTTTTVTTEKPLETITFTAAYVVQEIVSYPTKTIYSEGEELDLSGVSVKVRTETRWIEADGNRAGTIYGTPFVVDNITIPAEAVTISGENGAVWKGEDADKLKAGSYNVRTNNRVYLDEVHSYADFSNYKQKITYKEASVTTTASTTTAATTTEKTTTTVNYDGSEFAISVDLDKIGVDEKTTFRFTKGEHLIPFGRLDYDDDVISMKKNDDNTYEVTGLVPGSAVISFTAPTGQKKQVMITVGVGADFGDANRDGTVDLSDVVLIMQSLANPNKYGLNGTDKSHITEYGLTNADVNLQNGVTAEDALCIQKYLLKLIPALPVSVKD